MQNKLQKIIDKYCSTEFNEDNYGIGGGLDSCKFASRRHEDAKEDAGKLTEGEATQLFKKATGCELEYVKGVINYAIPNMEWHHAGKLPKSYGGGMKKTYFLNATEICNLATNWADYCSKYELSKATEQTAAEAKREREAQKLAFLTEHATKHTRIPESDKPANFYQTAQEMNGKYGWFDSSYKSCKLPVYLTGWEFKEREEYMYFLRMFDKSF